MRDDLFRRNARKERDDWLGQVRLLPPVAHWIWTAVALLILAVLMLWLFLGSYTRRERVLGHLVPLTGSTTVRAREYGEATDVLVKVGDFVKFQQPLMRFGSDKHQDDALGASEKSAAFINEQISILKSQLRNIDIEEERSLRGIREQIVYARSQLESSRSEQIVFEEEADNLTELSESLSSILDSGYISKVQLQQYRSNASAAKAAVLRKRSEISQIQRQISEMESQAATVRADAAITRSERLSQLADFERQLLSISAEVGGTILSPREGIVTRVSVFPGQSISPGSALVALMEANVPMDAELVVPSSAIGFISKGTKVLVRYKAFPSNKYGVHEAIVREISQAPLGQAEVAEILGSSAVTEGGYIVKATLVEQEPIPGKTLIPGMALEADVLQEKRRLYQWLVEPALSIRNGIKEGTPHGE